MILFSEYTKGPSPPGDFVIVIEPLSLPQIGSVADAVTVKLALPAIVTNC